MAFSHDGEVAGMVVMTARGGGACWRSNAFQLAPFLWGSPDEDDLDCPFGYLLSVFEKPTTWMRNIHLSVYPGVPEDFVGSLKSFVEAREGSEHSRWALVR